MLKTPRLHLPLLSVGQAQKELLHNEALLLLDLLVQPVTASPPSDTPPAEPVLGRVYLCDATPSGDWNGQAHSLALATEAGWRFAAPFEGQRVMSLETGLQWVFTGGTWNLGVVKAARLEVEGKTVISVQQPPIASAHGGTVVDTEARAALSAVLSSLRAHGLIAT